MCCRRVRCGCEHTYSSLLPSSPKGKMGDGRFDVTTVFSRDVGTDGENRKKERKEGDKDAHGSFPCWWAVDVARLLACARYNVCLELLLHNRQKRGCRKWEIGIYSGLIGVFIFQACSRSIFGESRSLNHLRMRTRFDERYILRLNNKILPFFCSNLESKKGKNNVN